MSSGLSKEILQTYTVLKFWMRNKFASFLPMVGHESYICLKIMHSSYIIGSIFNKFGEFINKIFNAYISKPKHTGFD